MTSTNQAKYTDRWKIRNLFLAPFQQKFLDVFDSISPTDCLEVGAGEGYLLSAMKKRQPQARFVGLDVDQGIINEGKRVFPDLDLRVGDAYRLAEPDHSWDVVVASEVLEHLDRPNEGLAEIARVAKRYVLVSVPWEPWFRLMNFARGKHLRRFGNHPEHVNNWTQKSFTTFIGTRLKVEKVIPAFPWTIILARV